MAKKATTHRGPKTSAAGTSPVQATTSPTGVSLTPPSGGLQRLKLDLENCYGIRKLVKDFDFTSGSAYAVYAGNGAMKSSLAQTFKDLADGTGSRDRVFPSRACKRIITDEHGVEIPADRVVAVRPYDEQLGHTEKTSTLLVNSTLRKQYEDLHIEIDTAKAALLGALRTQSGSKQDLELQISGTFTKDNNFQNALRRIKHELDEQEDAPFAEVRYDAIFDEKVLTLLGTKNVKEAIDAYIKKYNELLTASTYFKKGVFNYHNASTIAKSLADNGFFDAKHTVNLNGTDRVEITSQRQLEELIQREKDAILKDKQLRKQFDDIDKLINKNATVRDFQGYLADNEWIVPELVNVDALKEKIWKSYLKANIHLYNDLIEKYQAADRKRKEIEDQAAKERTQWEAVIDIFNDRFFVPFTLVAENRVSVILAQEPVLKLGFTYKDGEESAAIGKNELLAVLSTGEKKAFYILNVIFEVEARKKARQETIFVVDDVADSFDYKNKYAIIQYLKDVAEEPFFRQIILTHNFDFFRTVNSRFVKYDHCLMASKDKSRITLFQAAGIKNVFVNDWKTAFFTDARKRIASIPFIRNLIEYTRDETDPHFLQLTSLLHWKADSASITQADLDAIYTGVFASHGTWVAASESVVDAIKNEAQQCVVAASSVNFENKVVLSIAIRLLAERFMAGRINDPPFLASIAANQTPSLVARFKGDFASEIDAIETLDQVILMTPENIHLNSFMYEPILDMSDDHLRKLYSNVAALS